MLAHGVNVMEQELCLVETEPVDVALTKVQRAKSGQILNNKEKTKQKLLQATTKQEWKKEEAICNSIYEVIKQIQEQKDRDRQTSRSQTLTWDCLENGNSNIMEEVTTVEKSLPSLLNHITFSFQATESGIGQGCGLINS